jgi:hypothetical protein
MHNQRLRLLVSFLVYSLAFCVVMVLALSLGGSSAFAQYSSGIEGTVQDQSGALVPGATVTITDTRLGVEKATTTNEAGYFRFDSIAASTYIVRIQKTGFKSWEQKDLVLEVGQIRTLAPAMELGAVSTNVTVAAEVTAVDLASAKTGATISETTVAEVPLPGQNVYALASLIPAITGNAVTTGSNYANEYAININAAGLRQELNGYQIDGAYTNTPSRGGGTSISPSPEIVQSMNVLTNNFDAQKGRSGGATVQVFTKSGSNDLHGAFDYYFLNNSLSARTEFESTVPTFKRNEYSGALGGAIKKNKLFYFGSIDVLRSSTVSSYSATVETPDFVDWAKANLPNTIATSILQEATPQHAPSTGFLTVSQLESLNPGYYAPPANIPATLNAVGTANISYSVPNNGYQWFARIDSYLTPKDRVYGTGMRTYLSSVAGNARPALNFPLEYSTTFASLDWTHTFSPTLVNEAGVNMIRPYGANMYGPENEAFPYINVVGLQGFGGWAPGSYTQTTVGWRDVMTKMVKTHTLRFGFEQFNIREADRQQGGAGGRPTYNFNNLLDFIQDEATTMSGTPVDLTTHRQASWGFARRVFYTGFFFQDDWKVKPRFTLNLGVRYDATAHLFAILSPKLTNFMFGQGATYDEQIANGFVQVMPHNYFVDHNPWYITPRLGFAWDIFGDGKTALRGGFGMFADQPPFVQMTAQTANPPLIFQPSVSVYQGQTPVFQLCSPPVGFDEACPVVDTSNVSVNSSGGILIDGVLNRAAAYGYSPKSTMGQIYGWSLSLQRQLQGNLLLDVNYSGSAGHHLPVLNWTSDINRFAGDLIVNKGTMKRLNPNFGTIGYGTTDANSIGNYGSVSLTRRTSKGLIGYWIDHNNHSHHPERQSWGTAWPSRL